MLEILISDPLKAAVAREMVSALPHRRIAARVNAAHETVFVSPGIFLPHLHAETVGGAVELTAAGVTAWTLAVFGTDMRAIEREIESLAGSPLAAGEGFRGVFVEGPFVAMDGAPDFESGAFEAFLDSAALPIAAVAFAPERANPGALLPLLDEREICAVVAHTGADFAACLTAFENGASTLSLPFVSTAALHHRTPGPIGAAAEAGALCEAPIGMPGFTPQMAAFVAAAFRADAVPVYHPVAHPGRPVEARLPADFAAQAARAMGLGAREFLSLYGGNPSPRDTFALFDGELSVLAVVSGGRMEFQGKAVL